MSEDKLKKQFQTYVSHQMPKAENIEIGFINPIFGGASRQTYSIELNYTLDGKNVSQRVILRREIKSGIVETSCATEWEAYNAFYNTDVPVPRVLWIEQDSKWLDGPFFVMEEITGCQTSHYAFAQPPYNAVREKAGETFCRIMGTIHLTDSADIGLNIKLETPAPHECWKRELDYWEADANKNELEPNPIFRAAIRWLRRNPPLPAQKVTIIHGDMRAGNFLFNEKGDIPAILDWEMMHLGDPLEDLTYSLNKLWTWSEPDLMGFMIPRQQAIRIWEQTTGFKADPDSLFWWEVFTSIKAMAIWTSMNKTYVTATNTDPIICFGGLWAMDLQRRILFDQMKEARS